MDGLTHGCNLRDALAEARALGLRIDDVFRTGEVRIYADIEGVLPVTCNARRKDAPRRLTSLLRKVRAARLEPRPLGYRCRRCGRVDSVDNLPPVAQCECGCGYLESVSL